MVILLGRRRKSGNADGLSTVKRPQLIPDQCGFVAEFTPSRLCFWCDRKNAYKSCNDFLHFKPRVNVNHSVGQTSVRYCIESCLPYHETEFCLWRKPADALNEIILSVAQAVARSVSKGVAAEHSTCHSRLAALR